MNINTMIKAQIAIDKACPAGYIARMSTEERYNYTAGVIRGLRAYLEEELTVDEAAKLTTYIWDKYTFAKED